MKINVKFRIDDSKGISDFNVIIEGKYKDELEDLKKYIENYKGKIIVLDNNIIKSIDYNGQRNTADKISHYKSYLYKSYLASYKVSSVDNGILK